MGKLLEMMSIEWLWALLAAVVTVAATSLYERIYPAGGHGKEGAETDEHGAPKRFLVMKATGFLMFGLIPFILFLLVLGEGVLDWMGTWPDMRGWLAILVCLPLTITAGAIASRQEHVRELYPQMRIAHWSPLYLLISFTGWFIYLAGYEFLFRGMLLQLSIPVMGTIIATIINIALYSLAHLAKSPREALGAVPFGAVLCLLTIYTGSLLAPLLVHLSLSVSTEYFSIYRHPDMKFIGHGRK